MDILTKGIGLQGLGMKGNKGYSIGSPLDLKDACYKKVKAQYKVFPSAYASGAIAKCRKNKQMYQSPLSKVRKSEKGASLGRWFKEEWQTPSGDKDYSKGENLFRPKKRINSKTPPTWSDLTSAEKAAAQKEKNTKGRVSKFKKKE